MSGYTDDYEARGSREPEGRPERDDRLIERVKFRVKGPAVALLISGILSILAAGYVTFCSLSDDFNRAFDDAYDKEVAKAVEKWKKEDPNLAPQEMQERKQALAVYRDGIKNSMPIAAVLSFITGVVTIIGAILMMKLSGRGFTMIGSLMSMIPFVNTCFCVIGFPLGLWAIIVLLNSEVKEGFSAAAQAGRDPRDEY